MALQALLFIHNTLFGGRGRFMNSEFGALQPVFGGKGIHFKKGEVPANFVPENRMFAPIWMNCGGKHAGKKLLSSSKGNHAMVAHVFNIPANGGAHHPSRDIFKAASGRSYEYSIKSAGGVGGNVNMRM